jgi:hypothetical protein
LNAEHVGKAAIYPLLRAALASFLPRVTRDGNDAGLHKGYD